MKDSGNGFADIILVCVKTNPRELNLHE